MRGKAVSPGLLAGGGLKQDCREFVVLAQSLCGSVALGCLGITRAGSGVHPHRARFDLSADLCSTTLSPTLQESGDAMNLRSDFEEEKMVRIAILGKQIDGGGGLDFTAAAATRAKLTPDEEEEYIRFARGRVDCSGVPKRAPVVQCRCGSRRTKGGRWYVVDDVVLCSRCGRTYPEYRKEEYVA